MAGELQTALGALVTALVGYYAAWSLVHLAVTALGVRERRRWALDAGNSPPVTVAVPAYNEAETVVPTVRALLDQSSPVSVVVVDDGSTDGTFEALASAFDLRAAGEGRHVADAPLTVLRQANAGKAAALNAALATCETPLFGVVDADTVVESDAVTALSAPFSDPATVAAGGSLRVTAAEAASADIGGRLPASWFGRFQALDQLRAFVFRQLGRSRMGVMVHVFGACALYRTEQVRAVDGFVPAETEDFELAVRLRRHCAEQGRDCRLVQVPDAVAWTTVPGSVAALNEQRQRWVRGATTTLARNRDLLRSGADRRGALGLGYFLFGEVVWPIVEAVGYVLVPLAWLLGSVPTGVVGLFVAGLVVAGPVASAVAVYGCRGGDGYDAADRRALVVTLTVERLLWRPPQVFLGAVSALDGLR